MSGVPILNKPISLLKKLQHLRNFKGEQGAFFELYLAALLEASYATIGLITILDSSKDWKTLAYSKHPDFNKHLKFFFPLLSKGAGIYPCESGHIIVSALVFDANNHNCLYVAFLPEKTNASPQEAVSNINTLSDIYAQYIIRRQINDSLESKSQVASVFEINHLMNSQERFLPAVMALTGELSNRYHCDRVSLGWLQKGYIRIKAISHTDTFEKKMEIVRDLENAMEESLEQEACILFPNPEQSRFISKAHEYYYKKYNTGYLLSVPIEKDGAIIGIITFERERESFNEREMSFLFLCATQVSTRLENLFNKSRWLGSRFFFAARNMLSPVLGYEHTWLKLFIFLFFAFALFAALVPVPYRVDAPAILMTDKTIYLTAPFEGYIDSVFVKPGDVLSNGQVIIKLDQKQLKLEEADLMAEEQNYRREIQKARAIEELAELRIFEARLAQVQAKLQTVRFKIEQAVIRSKMDNSVVVTGDLQKRIGAPVRAGEELFQIALIENLYVEVDVNESEIENVKIHANGFVAIKSRPEFAYSFNVERINPRATIKEQINTFQVRGEFTKNIPEWFRPGMTGIAKIESGKKTLWWILTHTAIDYIRLKLWW